MKANLQHITFTGIDDRTSIKTLCEIQRKYPFAEFGILTSYHWAENGNRYLSPSLISSLRGKGLNLSLHVCGSAARDAALGKWSDIDKLIQGNLDIFLRIQLNIAEREDCPEYCWFPAQFGPELIIQQHSVKELAVYKETLEHWFGRDRAEERDPISLLLDASGGRGVDTPINVFLSRGKVGYAGGINTDNVGEKLSYLLEHKDTGNFWIDMESGVRTNDWFDTGKVSKVLQTARQVIDKKRREITGKTLNWTEEFEQKLTEKLKEEYKQADNMAVWASRADRPLQKGLVDVESSARKMVKWIKKELGV